VLYINIANSMIGVGYVSRLDMHEGVYLGDAVTNRGYGHAFNTNSSDLEIPVQSSFRALKSLLPRMFLT